MLDRLRGLARRVAFYLRRDQYERELGEEMDFHLEMSARASGADPASAPRAARRKFGSRSAIAEDARDVWAVRCVEALSRDVRVALRGFRRNKGFTAVALITLGLGIGGTTALFSLVYRALFEPLSYPAAERIASLTITGRDFGDAESPFPWSYPKFVSMRSGQHSFDAVAGFVSTNLNLRGTERPERVAAEIVSAEYFDILGGRAALGRTFARGDDSVPDLSPVVILSDDLWRRHFASDPGILGRQISLGGLDLTVIGVMPRGFRALSGTMDLWVPMMMAPALQYRDILDEAGNHWLNAVGRLAPTATVGQAKAEMRTVGRRVDEQFAQQHPGTAWSATMVPLVDQRVDPAVRRATVVLFGAVGFVLLIACANVAGLMVVRSNARKREQAVRGSLGASRGALARQLLVETGLLGLGGGLGGIGLALLLARLLERLGPTGSGATLALLSEGGVGLSWPVLGFGLLASLITGLAIGLIPARQVNRLEYVADLRGGVQPGSMRHLTTGRGGSRQLLIVAEVALATVLLIGAGLMVRSLSRLQGTDRGFASRGILTFHVAPGDLDLAARTPAEFKARAIQSLAGLPGVEAVGVGSCTPLSSNCNGSVVKSVDDRQFDDHTKAVPIGVHDVSDGYFRALGIRLLEGRNFDQTERPGSPRVVIVNQHAAQQLWPGQSPIGRRIAIWTSYFSGGDSAATVIGVVNDVRYQGADQPANADVYTPALQRTFGRAAFFLKVRAGSDPFALAESARRAIQAQDPNLPVYGIRSMEEIDRAATSRTRFAALLLTMFSGTALLLAAIGVYGVIAFAVAGRAKEIGIRMAIGAQQASVVRLIVGQGLYPVLGGLALGVGGALGLTRVMREMLFEVAPNDPTTFIGAAMLLGLAGLGASWLPARKAARVDPVEVLRSDG